MAEKGLVRLRVSTTTPNRDWLGRSGCSRDEPRWCQPTHTVLTVVMPALEEPRIRIMGCCCERGRGLVMCIHILQNTSHRFDDWRSATCLRQGWRSYFTKRVLFETPY
jgi:hypothetical protein